MPDQMPTCYSLMDEAYRLRVSAIAESHGVSLDERSAMWVIKDDAWREMRRHESLNMTTFAGGGRPMNRLFGLPVRVTIGDDDDTPMIQLVMEPRMMPRHTYG